MNSSAQLSMNNSVTQLMSRFAILLMKRSVIQCKSKNVTLSMNKCVILFRIQSRSSSATLSRSRNATPLMNKYATQ